METKFSGSKFTESKDNNLEDPTLVIYNKHLCEICRPALDYIRGVPVSNGRNFHISEEGGKVTIKYHFNNRNLQQGIEEGCYMCGAIYDYAGTNYTDQFPLGHCYLEAWKFSYYAGEVRILHWYLRKPNASDLARPLQSDWFRVYSKLFDVECFGPPLKARLESNSSSDMLLAYQRPADMTSNSLWKLVSQWINRCCANHECSESTVKSPAVFPTRLVELETTSTGLQARLVETEDSGFIKGPYLTLSHIWGSDQFLTLTSSNIQEFYTKIPIEKLRVTFKEALMITKKLGFRYIWIDSLCIVQGLDNDWRFQSARMGDVYRGSACNLAACVNPVKAQNLLDRNRDVKGISPLTFKDAKSGQQCRVFNRGYWTARIDSHELNRRGWVLQERLLAPRVVYFGAQQVFWECSQAMACEAKPDGFSHILSKNAKGWISRMQSSTAKSGHDEECNYFVKSYTGWSQIVCNYSDCDLTQLRDKLIALSGIAKEVQKLVKDEYLAGLWRDTLVHDLQWDVREEARRSQNYRAPSWSWASIDGGVAYNIPSIRYGLVDIRQASTQALTDDPTGEIIDARLVLSGILREVTLKGEGSGPSYWIGNTPEGSGPGYWIGNTPIYCRFDTHEDSELQDIHCISLAVGTSVKGLLLRRSANDDRTYHKVGTFETKRLDSLPLEDLVNVLNFPVTLADDPQFIKLLKEVAAPWPSWRSRKEKMAVLARFRDYMKPFMETITII